MITIRTKNWEHKDWKERIIVSDLNEFNNQLHIYVQYVNIVHYGYASSDLSSDSLKAFEHKRLLQPQHIFHLLLAQSS